MRDKSRGQIHRDPLPESFSTLDEAGEFWDTHSSADYEDEMEAVDVEVDLSASKVYCAIESDLARRLREQARREGVSTAELIHRWREAKIRLSTLYA